MTFFDIFNLYILIKNITMKTLHIDDEVHNSFKKYCKDNGYQINKLTEIIIEEFIKNKNTKNDNNKKH